MLAKEIGIPYALIGLVTDYDSWKENNDTVNFYSNLPLCHIFSVNVQAVASVIQNIAESARNLILNVIREIPIKGKLLKEEIEGAKVVLIGYLSHKFNTHFILAIGKRCCNVSWSGHF